MRVKVGALFVLTVAVTVRGDVFSSEFSSHPLHEGWDLVQEYCDPETWVENGWYQQEFDLVGCPPPPPDGDQEAYSRWLTDYNGALEFFLEFRVLTDGERSEIPGGAPSGVAMGNFFGVLYHVTVARDQVKFLRDVDLPIWFIDIHPDVAHCYRIELCPDRYIFYIDGDVADEGVPEGPFPSHDSRITWVGRAWYLSCHNSWDYVRYGVIPQDGSGDYNSDAEVGLDDFYFFHECLTNRRMGINGGPGQDAGPGCRFADFDDDTDVDLHDLAAFQRTFTGQD